MSDSRKAKWKELKAGNPDLKKPVGAPTNPAYGPVDDTVYSKKDLIQPTTGVDRADDEPDVTVHSMVLDPTIRAENDDLKQRLAQKMDLIDALTTAAAEQKAMTAAVSTVCDTHVETIAELRAELDASKTRLEALGAKQKSALEVPPAIRLTSEPGASNTNSPPADAGPAFKSFIISPAGRDLTDYRIPAEPGRLVGVLEDRARMAFLEGFRIGRGE